MAENTLELHRMYMACAKTGCVVVPINCSFTATEVAEVLTSTRPALLVCGQEFLMVGRKAMEKYAGFQARVVTFDEAFAGEERDVDYTCVTEEKRGDGERVSNGAVDNNSSVKSDGWGAKDMPSILSNDGGNEHADELHRPWVVLHTSGTTAGKKKGVVRSQFGTIAGIFIHQAALKIDDRDVFLAVWPSYGISTFFFTFGLLYLGCRVVIVHSTIAANPQACCEIMKKEKVTFTTGSPAYFQSLAALPKECIPTSLRTALWSGTTATDVAKKTFRNKFPECVIGEAYGSTECGVLTMSIYDPHVLTIGAGVGSEPVGIPRIKIAKESNEILANITTPMFMNGYVGLSSAEIETYFTMLDDERWFKTGDVGRRDGLGRVHLLGRTDDRIGLPSGHDVYPAEIERVLEEVHPNVCSIVCFPNDEVLTIVVEGVCEDERLALNFVNAAELHLAPYKRPERVLFYGGAFPRTTTNKIKRKELTEIVNSRIGHSSSSKL